MIMNESRKRIAVYQNHFVLLQVFFLLANILLTENKKQKLVSSGTEINSETDEPDSLEPVQEVTSSTQNVSGTIRPKRSGDKRKNTETSPNESDLLALLQLERLAQQASRRDYELLRKQYQRYFFLTKIFQSFLAVQ